jgi:DNA invertase Pin-like site-specific DNA recombinase
MNRPELKRMLEYVREGDILYVESFSRLARSLLDLLSIVDTLQKKNVDFVSLKENIDTTTPAGRLQLVLFGAIAEFERETIRERQQEGIKLALAEKRPYGRPKAQVTDNLRNAYLQWKRGNITAIKAMEKAGVKRTTFYKLVKELDKEYKGLPLFKE